MPITALRQRLHRSLNLAPEELPALLWAFAYFFCLLCSYYLLRPLRDAMGIAGGVDKLQWLFTATFVVMLVAVPVYGWAVARFRRARLLPVVYGFFVANLLLFFVLFRASAEHSIVEHTSLAQLFFVWVSVYNLFVVSVFWSFMADVFSPERAQRLFAVIAAGGTTGALVGPALAAACSQIFDPATLLLLAAITLAATLVCVSRLARWAQADAHRQHANSRCGQGSFCPRQWHRHRRVHT
ncbi:MAG: AAA family ATP:ADP antiporter [Gammaproteobacteria bacterium]|jgi:AAA family ATP:ADP antiporter